MAYALKKSFWRNVPNRYFHLDNLERRDFSGMAARYIKSKDGYKAGVRFSDGTELYWDFPPRDTVPVPSFDQVYFMRWQRIWQDYYVVSLYNIFDPQPLIEALMREKNGKNISAVLGNSHSHRSDHSQRLKAWTEFDEDICISTRHMYPDHYTLVPVSREKLFSLSPDFPKGVVRWAPILPNPFP